MSRIAWTPLWLAVFTYSHIVTFFAARRVREAVRCLAGVVGAGAAYMAVMLPIVMILPPQESHAAMAYAAGMAIATVAGTVVAGLVFPRRYRETGMMVSVGLLLAYPLAVAACSEPGAPVHLMQSLYVFATAAGGGLGLTVMSQARRAVVVSQPFGAHPAG
jgi:glucose dehydrogenase